MALLENISRTVTGAIQGAKQKTEENADITKLNTDISTLKLKINQEYRNLGDRYFRLCKGNPVPELTELVGTIQALHNQIRECESQIRKLKGRISCPKCGAEMDKSAMFCISCGTRLVPEDSILCPVCSGVLPFGALFCTNCGTKISEKVTEKSDQSGIGTSPKCSSCGATLSENDVFCVNCGTRVPGKS